MANLANLFGNKAFNPANVDPLEMDFLPLPKGVYVIMITDSEISQTKTGTGTLLTLKLIVQEDKFKNRILFDNLCVQHRNNTAERIGQTKLAQICEALSIKQLKDSAQLHDQLLQVNIELEFDEYQTNKKQDGERYYRNNVKKYLPINRVATEPTASSKASKDVDYDDDIPF